MVVALVSLVAGCSAGGRHGASPADVTTTVPVSQMPPPTSTTRIATSTTTSMAATPVTTGAIGVPVVVCPTDAAISGGPTYPIRPSVTLAGLPAAARLALYADSTGHVVVLAPRGWKCSAGLGVDGSGGLAVYPSDGTAATDPYNVTPAPAAAVSLSTDGACSGCIFGSVCAYLPNAPIVRSGGFSCQRTIPPREVLTHASETLTRFEDPGGVHGTGRPSGGVNVAMGLVMMQSDIDTDWTSTCTLPDPERDLCNTILLDVIDRHQGQSAVAEP